MYGPGGRQQPISMEIKYMKKNRKIVFMAALVILVIGCENETYETRGFTDKKTIINYTGTKKNIVIPEEINGGKITEIGEFAFRGAKIQTVIIPDTVVKIGRNAFQDCLSLSAIQIPDSVTQFGSNIFANCPLLTPDSGNAKTRWLIAQSKFFWDRRDESKTLDDYLALFSLYFYPYHQEKGQHTLDYALIDSGEMPGWIGYYVGSYIDFNVDYQLPFDDDETPPQLTDDFGSKPDKKILILEKWMYQRWRYQTKKVEFEHRVHLEYLSLLPREYIPASTSEVEYVISLIHREGDKEAYGYDGVVKGYKTGSYVDVVIHRKTSSSGFIKVTSLKGPSSVFSKTISTTSLNTIDEVEESETGIAVIRAVNYNKKT
jgi:hypothetical protein